MAIVPSLSEQEKKEAAQKTFVKLKEELLNTEISYGKSLMVLQGFLQKKRLEIKAIVKNDDRLTLFEKAIKSALDANNKTKEMLMKLNSENLSPAEYIKTSGEFIAVSVIPQLSNGLLAFAGFRDLIAKKKENLEKLSRGTDLDSFASGLGTSNGGFSSNLITITQRGPRYDMLYAEMNKQNNVISGEADKDNVLGNIKAANKVNNSRLGDYVEALDKAKENAKVLRENFIDNKGKPKNNGEPKIIVNQIPRSFKMDKASLDLIKQTLGGNFSVSKKNGGFFGSDSLIVSDGFGQSLMKITLNTKFWGESSITIKPLINPKSPSNSINTQGLLEAMVQSTSALEESIGKIRKGDKGGGLDIKGRDFVQPILNSMVNTHYLTEELSVKTKNKYSKELEASYKTLDNTRNANPPSIATTSTDVPKARIETVTPTIMASPPLLSESMKAVNAIATSQMQQDKPPEKNKQVSFSKQNQGAEGEYPVKSEQVSQLVPENDKKPKP